MCVLSIIALLEHLYFSPSTEILVRQPFSDYPSNRVLYNSYNKLQIVTSPEYLSSHFQLFFITVNTRTKLLIYTQTIRYKLARFDSMMCLVKPPRKMFNLYKFILGLVGIKRENNQFIKYLSNLYSN